MLGARRMAVDADGLNPEHFEPTDVGQGIADGRHLPVEDRADLTVGEGEVARLGVAVHQGHPRAGLGLARPQRQVQPLKGRQRVALDAVHLCGPVVEFAVEVAAAVIECAQPGLFEVDGVDRRDLFGQALAHPRHRRVVHTGRALPSRRHPRAARSMTKNGCPRTSPLPSSHSAAGARTAVSCNARRMANWRARS